ncbi:MAG: hypothetical protein B6I28_00445 [Fusobacteriia bacterium 4572_132]|nr:MAG: hypothetical protein B6I28_00445 [Fusobacteriia bacterium 4572_132]
MATKTIYNKQKIIHNIRLFKEKLEKRGTREDLEKAELFLSTERYINKLEKENKELSKNLKKKTEVLSKIISSTSDVGQQSFL